MRLIHSPWSAGARRAAIVIAGLCWPFLCDAQAAFPSRVIRLIVPVAPGGGADAVARMISEKMSQSLGAAIVIENKAGASGSIAALEVARAAPDGYTLMQCFVATHSTNPAVLKIKYDPIADFAPVGMMAQTSNVLVVNEKIKARDLQEFLELARTRQGGMSFSSAGSGSATHLIMEYLENQAHVKLVHVPYTGAAPAMQDLLGGQVDAMFPSLTTALPISGRASCGRWPWRRCSAIRCCPKSRPWPSRDSRASAPSSGGVCARQPGHRSPWWHD
jgi:tripartite-type tricarboxylate transporter receptor subunit TctC